MTFKELNFHSDIQEGLDAMYFEKPTPVQELAIPVIMEGRDIIDCCFFNLPWSRTKFAERKAGGGFDY